MQRTQWRRGGAGQQGLASRRQAPQREAQHPEVRGPRRQVQEALPRRVAAGQQRPGSQAPGGAREELGGLRPERLDATQQVQQRVALHGVQLGSVRPALRVEGEPLHHRERHAGVAQRDQAPEDGVPGSVPRPRVAAALSQEGLQCGGVAGGRGGEGARGLGGAAGSHGGRQGSRALAAGAAGRGGADGADVGGGDVFEPHALRAPRV
mmetsp:Transcript_63391/g.185331  ORF Transcript_63391/g.185331 Transcript_63391/m.185331 type:complete len:208 (+) Transcript_63391:753-1376(+)